MKFQHINWLATFRLYKQQTHVSGISIYKLKLIY